MKVFKPGANGKHSPPPSKIWKIAVLVLAALLIVAACVWIGHRSRPGSEDPVAAASASPGLSPASAAPSASAQVPATASAAPGPTEPAESSKPTAAPAVTDPPATANPGVTQAPVATTHPPLDTLPPTVPPTASIAPATSSDLVIPSGGAQDVPEQAEVDDSFFDDAAMLGNSLADGFRLYSGLTNMDIYAATSLNVYGADSLISQMASHEYAKIYTFLGINEIYTTPSAFAEQYGKIIDQLQANHPDAVIYIISITPVSKSKAQSDSLFSMENIRAHNIALYDLAGEKGCYYLDLCSALEDEEGYLPADVTFDGVHFTVSQYKIWLDFLKTHYV